MNKYERAVKKFEKAGAISMPTPVEVPLIDDSASTIAGLRAAVNEFITTLGETGIITIQDNGSPTE